MCRWNDHFGQPLVIDEPSSSPSVSVMMMPVDAQDLESDRR
jgi:hypothetical protein